MSDFNILDKAFEAVSGSIIGSPETRRNEKILAGAIMALTKVAFPNKQVEILSSPNTIFNLSRLGHEHEVISVIKASKPDDKIKMLASPNAVSGLVRNDNPIIFEEILNIIKSVSPNAKTEILSSEGSVHALISSGDTEEVLSIIESLSLDNQARILAKDDGEEISKLADMGYGDRIMTLIEMARPNDQATMLYSLGAITGLTDAGYGERVMSVIENAPSKDKVRMLQAGFGMLELGKNGYADRIIDVIKNQTLENQAAILLGGELDDAFKEDCNPNFTGHTAFTKALVEMRNAISSGSEGNASPASTPTPSI